MVHFVHCSISLVDVAFQLLNLCNLCIECARFPCKKNIKAYDIVFVLREKINAWLSLSLSQLKNPPYFF